MWCYGINIGFVAYLGVDFVCITFVCGVVRCFSKRSTEIVICEGACKFLDR